MKLWPNRENATVEVINHAIGGAGYLKRRGKDKEMRERISLTLKLLKQALVEFSGSKNQPALYHQLRRPYAHHHYATVTEPIARYLYLLDVRPDRSFPLHLSTAR